ncbi:MAG: c-type cytochrome [Nitrospirae bacterium]|nr:c-type cytochrome [Nitrospirota bacterium]NTW64932.1 c-type cytochrome [Nitrospirota bacterium]
MGEFDGIQEREEGKKKMPLGMTVLFMGLIIFGLAYMYLFMPQTTGWTQAGRYEAKIKAREAEVAGRTRPDAHPETEHEQMQAAEKGKEIYLAECAVCHGNALEGGIGPSLRGPKFKHGPTVEDHVRVITKGTEEGMPGFEQLGAAKIRSVASYIHTSHQH